MSKFIITTLLFLCGVSIIQAQGNYHKFEVYGGYSRDFSSNPNLVIDGAFNEREAGNGDEKSFNGFNASATYNFSKLLGIKFDVADHFSTGTIQTGVITGNAGGNTKLNRFALQGGLQIKNNSKEARFKPFGHVLAGIHRQSIKIDTSGQGSGGQQSIISAYGNDKISSTGFAATFGGGLDIRLTKRIDIRVAQFNYTLNNVSGKTLAQTNSAFGGIQSSTAIRSARQNQYTFGFGIVFH